MPPPETRRLRLLSPAQILLLGFVMAGAGFMIADSVYLALAAHALGVGDDPHHLPTTYQTMLVLHIVVGTVVFVPAVVFALWHLPKALMRKSKGTIPTGISVLVVTAFLFVSGFFILTAANSEANRWAFVGHQVCAAFMPLVYLAHRMLSNDRPPGAVARRGTIAMVVVVLVAGALHGLEAMLSRDHSEPTPHVAIRPDVPAVWRNPPIEDPFVPFQAAGHVNPASPFFPAATTTSSGDQLTADIIHHGDFPDQAAYEAETRRLGFAPSHYLGAQTCKRCHADIVEQWATSAHRFASFNNPFYRKAVELTRTTVGKEKSQWCGGCHDPAIMLAGNMTEEIDPVTLEAQAGLTCLACHAIDRIHNQTGNGNYNIQDEVPSPYAFDTVKDGLGRFLHDYVLKAKPVVHKRRMLKPFFRKSEFCAPCHKVSLDVPVNHYRWLRGQNEYDSWQNSGVPHNNPMTWYEPPGTKECQDCHMPLEDARLGDVAAKGGKVRSHRFLAVNTALPAIRGDLETIKRIEADLQDEKLRVDVFALKRESGATVMALDVARPVVKPGERIQIDVVVRNQGVGHTFPGGTNDSNEGWLSFKVTGPAGEIWHSGKLSKDRRVDPAAHFFRSVLVDQHGQRIAKRNAPDIYTAVYANVIPPSGSDIARYAFTVPEDCPDGDLVLEADLRWRKFNREYTEFVFEGKPVPDLPITRIASDRVTLRVSRDGTGGAAGQAPDPGSWMRFNDYGVGLALDGVTGSAQRAFAEVAKLAPDRVDGWRNQARVFFIDGVFDRAEAMLRKASAAAPDDPKNAFWWGRLHEERGGQDLDRAVEAYTAVSRFYPDSRDTWERLGRTYIHLERYEEAIAAFLQVLRIDPEHALAHDKRRQCYESLAGVTADAARKAAFTYAAGEAAKAYAKYKIDEDAQKGTLDYRQQNPHDHRMSQTIVVHEQPDS